MHIRTKLHVLEENIDPITMKSGKDYDVVKEMAAAASYVIDRDVIELLSKESTIKSLEALIEADITRLPLSPMLIEFNRGGFQEFVLLREVTDTVIEAKYATLEVNSGVAMLSNYPIKFAVFKSPDGKHGFNSSSAFPESDKAGREIIYGSFVGLMAAMLMLNTRGIEKEVIETERLNRKRREKGRVTIPKHTVVHIGHIYQKDGSVVRNGGGGWHMPMHMRAGYTRSQHYGKNRALIKTVYIPPCIVNFVPDEEVKMPKKAIRV